MKIRSSCHIQRNAGLFNHNLLVKHLVQMHLLPTQIDSIHESNSYRVTYFLSVGL